MKQRIILFLAIMAFAAGTANAQYNETNNLFYTARRAPQSNMFNPAFFPSSTGFYLTLPSTDIHFGSPLSFHDVIHYDSTQDLTVIDLNHILHTLSDENRFRMGTDIGLLGFGFKIGHFFFDFGTKLNMGFSIGLPIGTVQAVVNGNVGPDGNPITEATLLDGDLFNAQSYIETSIGAGYYIEPIHLTVGAHAKLLSGLFNIQTDKTKVVLNTEDDYEEVSARVYYELQYATVLPIDTSIGITSMFQNFHPQDLLTLTDIFGGNNGLAFDIGAKYDFGPLSISASINDLTAGIHWQRNVNTTRPEGGQGVIEFQGMEVRNILNHGTLDADSIVDYLSEQLNALMPYSVLDSGDYWFSVPTKINLAATFTFLKVFRAGLLMHGQFDRGILCKNNPTQLDLGNKINNPLRFNATASFGVNLFNWLEVIGGTSVVYDSKKMDFFNPGAGIILSPGTAVQIYAMVDYVSSIYLTESKAFNLKFGTNILIGNGGKHKLSE